MRAIWSGTITFGLVTIPIKLYKATEEKRMNLDMLHKDDLSPIRYARICRADGQEIPYSDIVKGYEYQKGDYIILTDEDFKKASPEKSQTIEISDFVKESEISPEYFEQPYYLEPGKGAAKSYALLRESLKRSKKVAVGEFVLRDKEHLGIIMPHGNVLVLNTLRYHDQVRNADEELKLPKASEAKGREIELALKLIDEMTSTFKPENYKDEYRHELEAIIKKKATGGKVKASGKQMRPRTNVHDLAAALRASINKKSRYNNRAHA